MLFYWYIFTKNADILHTFSSYNSYSIADDLLVASRHYDDIIFTTA